MDHDWHLFDAEQEESEVRRVDDRYELRRVSNPDRIVTVSEREWNLIRTTGRLPVALYG